MLNLEVDGHKTMIVFNGDLVELSSSLGKAINHIYQSLGQRDAGAAEAFRGAMTALFTDPDSPLWTEKISGTGVALVDVKEGEGTEHG